MAISLEKERTVHFLNSTNQIKAKSILTAASLLFIASIITYLSFSLNGWENLNIINMTSLAFLGLSSIIIGVTGYLLIKKKRLVETFHQNIGPPSFFNKLTSPISGATPLILSYLSLKDFFQSKRASRFFWHASQSSEAWSYFYSPSIFSLKNFSKICLSDAQLETLLQKQPSITSLSIPHAMTRITTLTTINHDIFAGLSSGNIFGWQADNHPLLTINFDPNQDPQIHSYGCRNINQIMSLGNEIFSFANQSWNIAFYSKKSNVLQAHEGYGQYFIPTAVTVYKQSLILAGAEGRIGIRLKGTKTNYPFSIDKGVSAMVSFDKGFISGHMDGSIYLFQESEDTSLSFEPKQAFTGASHCSAISFLSIHEGMLFSLSSDQVHNNYTKYVINIWNIENRQKIKEVSLNIENHDLGHCPFLQKGILFLSTRRQDFLPDHESRASNLVIEAYSILRKRRIATITPTNQAIYSLYFKNSSLFIGSEQLAIGSPIVQRLDF